MRTKGPMMIEVCSNASGVVSQAVFLPSVHDGGKEQLYSSFAFCLQHHAPGCMRASAFSDNSLRRSSQEGGKALQKSRLPKMAFASVHSSVGSFGVYTVPLTS